MIANVILYFAIILALSNQANSQPTKQCQALVLQGGGDKGAYEAGVFWGLVYNATNPENVQYDVVTGISAGAINALGLALYDIGDEINAANFLTDTWKELSRDTVYVYWPGGIIQSLLFKQSITDNSPLKKTLQKLVKSPMRRKITVGTTDANSGAYVTFNDNDFINDLNMAVNSVVFSSAIPVFFPPQFYKNYAFIDGGLSFGMDIASAVKRCMEIVDDQSQITIDIIMTSSASLANVVFNDYTTLQMLIRYLEITYWKKYNEGIVDAYIDFPEVNFRYAIGPSQTLPNSLVPLDFDPENINFMINLGIKDAINAIKKGEGVSFGEYLTRASGLLATGFASTTN